MYLTFGTGIGIVAIIGLIAYKARRFRKRLQSYILRDFTEGRH